MEVAGVPIFPPQASTQAAHVDLLLAVLLALATFFTVLIAVLIIAFTVRYRRRSEDQIPEQIAGSTRLELFWTAVPLVLALGVFYWGAKLYLDVETPPPNATEIYVVARQWMWKFEHLGGQQEINELHVPIGQPIQLIMTAQDVIHSFYVPAFRVKQDVLPDRYTSIWFQATRVGEYHLFCAEYCGTEHANMVGTVIVMQPAEFETWLEGGAAESMAAQGQRLFQQLGCTGCHRNDTLRRAPVLEGLFGQPVQLQDGSTVIADESYIRESILNPNAKVVAGFQPIMPSFQGRIGTDQLSQLIAYIKSVGPGGGQSKAQPGVPANNTPGPTPAVALTQAAPATAQGSPAASTPEPGPPAAATGASPSGPTEESPTP